VEGVRYDPLVVVTRHLKQSGGPLPHQMLKINHLLTLRSPNASDSKE